jgi:ABC-type glycerol-3-phosphate transport system permease component
MLYRLGFKNLDFAGASVMSRNNPNTLQKIGLYNTRAGLVLVFLVVTMPNSIWMLKGFFDTIPYEIEGAVKS